MAYILPKNGRPSVKNCQGCPSLGKRFVFSNHQDSFGIYQTKCFVADRIPGNLAECPRTHCEGCGFAKACNRSPVDCGHGIPGVVVS